MVLALVWAGTCLGQFPGDAVILETSEEGETLLLSGAIVTGKQIGRAHV